MSDELGKISLTYWNRDIGKYVYAVRKGKVFDLDGKKIELFPVRVFAESLDRSSQCITLWHKKGILPLPMFKVPGSSQTRWYSRWQIRNATHIYQTEFDRKDRYFDAVKFGQRMRGIWYFTEFLPGVEDK